MLRWLERLLGRYPFDRAGTVVVPADSAMETQTLVTERFTGTPLRRFVTHWLDARRSPR